MEENQFNDDGDFESGQAWEVQDSEFEPKQQVMQTAKYTVRERRKRLNDILDKKRLTEELDDYDFYLSNKGRSYDDNLLDEYDSFE